MRSIDFFSLSVEIHVDSLDISFLTPKPFLISRIDYNPSVIWIAPKALARPAS